MQRPCMVWEDKFKVDKNSKFYPLEKEKHRNCTLDPVSKKKFDPRFHDTGYDINELDL